MAKKVKALTIGESVRTRVREVREFMGLSIRALAREVAKTGHKLDASGIKRLEDGERRTSVEDLIALAVALNVSPDVLVLPLTDDVPIEVPGLGVRPSGVVRLWLTGAGTLLPIEHTQTRTREGLEMTLKWVSQRPKWQQDAALAGMTRGADDEIERYARGYVDRLGEIAKDLGGRLADSEKEKK